MSNNNVQVNGGTSNSGSSNPNANNGQHPASTGHDLHNQSGVPLMHGTVDELLSADFPIVVRPDEGAGQQGNIMEGLDIFSDDFPAVNANLGLHMPQSSQPLSSGMHFTASQSPQGGLSPMQQQQVQQMQGQGLLQPQQQLPSTPSQLSRSPHVSPAIAHAALPVQQQAPSVLSHQYPAHQLQPGVVAARPVYQLQQPGQQQMQMMNQQQLMNQQASRGGQPNFPPMPGLPQTPGVPNSQPTMPSAVRPPTTTAPSSTPVAQAGSPLHHILSSCSPSTRVQLNNLFALLQSNAVTPNEFLARAEKLLDPAQVEILDSIRRRHGVARTPADPQGQQPSPSGPISVGVSVGVPGVMGAGHTGPIHNGPAGVNLPSIATPTLAGSVPTHAASIAGTSLPPTSAGALQSAPVRKRNTDGTSPTPATPDSKVASKRVKTEHQALPLGANGPGAQIAVPTVPTSFPATPVPGTPGGVPNSGVYSRVSLPGQQRMPPTAMGPGVVVPGGAGAGGVGPGGVGATAKASAAGTEKVNIEDITDVMGYSGVDLKEESDNIMRDNDGYSRSNTASDGQDRTRVQNFVNLRILKASVERVAAKHRIQAIDPDVLAYLAMAAQERLRSLAEQMILASKHRGRSLATAPPPMYDEDHPMYKVAVNQDVKKQLLAIERVEREEETKRKEQIAERERRLAAGEDLDENGEPRGMPSAAGAKKTKKQKEGGPGVSARNMTEEARKKVANQTALGFAGGSGRTYSWMMGGSGAGGEGGAGGAASPLPSSSTPGPSSGAASTGSPSASGMGSGGSAKPSLGRNATIPTLASSSSSSSLASGVGIGSPGVTGSLSSGTFAPSSLSRGAVSGGGSIVLPPSTVGRPVGLRDTTRKVNVKDALFCLERDRGGGGGEGSGQRVLIKSYVKWLK